MFGKLSTAIALACALTQYGAAQSTVTTSGGNAGTIPIFSGTSSIDLSNLFQYNGNIGIGISNPAAPLSVLGNVVIGSNYHGDASLHITGAQGCCGRLTQFEAVGTNTDALNIMSSTDASGGSHYWTWGVSQNQWTVNPGTNYTHDSTTFTINQSGYVGIGTFTPSAALEVHNGNVLLSGSGASITFPDGSVQSTAWNGTTMGGDYAESIDVSGSSKSYEAGDVLTIDPDSLGRFKKAEGAYSKLVAGVYSTKPGLVGRRITTARPDPKAEIPLALAGIVPVKVTDENGSVHPGDLLVTSSRPGYAMRGTDETRMTGSVIGKSLGSLASGDGVLEVMISLQ